MGHDEPRAGSGRDATVHAGIILASSSYCQVKSMSRVRRGRHSRRFGRLAGRAIFCSLVLIGSACTSRSEGRFDKIILISIDTLRADYLGAYGAPVELTPAIDALAGSGVLFDDAITSATSTLPSHTSLFYSVHTFVHNAYTGNPSDPQITSPVEVLRRAGYRTAAFVGGGQLRSVFSLDRGFETYEVVNTRNINSRTRDTDRLAQLVTAANGFLEQHGDEPFFLFLHTYEPHTPYNPPARFIEQVRALDTGGAPRSSTRF